MIRINLIPFRAARKKENIRRQVSVFLLSLILVLIVAFWFNYLLSSNIKKLNKQIETTQAQVDKYNKINQEIEEIKAKLELLNKKIQVIKSLDLNRKAPVELLNDMSLLVVEKRMWLTSLSEKAGKVKVDGISVDNPTIAEYMSRLENSKKYSDVKLLSISQNKSIEGLTLKNFGITFNAEPNQTKAK